MVRDAGATSGGSDGLLGWPAGERRYPERRDSAVLARGGAWQGMMAVLGSLLIAAGPVARGVDAPTAVVVLRDGGTLSGEAAFESGALVISTAGKRQRIELDRIGSVEFAGVVCPTESTQAAAPARSIPEAPSGGGLRGEYYADREMKELRLVRVDERIDFNWPADQSPDPLVPAVFAVRWTGDVEPVWSDVYTFHVEAYSGVRLWIDGELIIDRWGFAPGVFTGTAKLRAGCRHGIRLEYHNTQYGGHVRLHWSSRRQDYELIGPQRLIPPVGTRPPAVRIVRPRDDELVVLPDPVGVEVRAGNRDDEISMVRLLVDDGLLATLQRPPWRFEWTRAAPGVHRLQASATDRAGITAGSRCAHVIVAERGDLPAPWAALSVGTSSPAGRAAHSDGRFVLTGTAGGMSDEGDVFHFAMRPLAGDGAVVARLAEFDGAAGAAAGLMLRQSLRCADSRCAFLGLTGGGGVVLLRRESSGEPCRSGEYEGAAPVWLKLQRHGQVVRASRSGDGRNWELLAARNLPGDGVMYAGVAVWGQARAVFDNLALVAGAPPPANLKGVVLRSGSFIAGDADWSDAACVRVGPRGRHAVPRWQVARVVFAPLPADGAEQLVSGRRGVLLRSGDFLDGDVASIGDGRIVVDSVLFGPRHVPLAQAAAAVLRDVVRRPGTAEVELADGSVLRARSLAIDGGALVAEDEGGLRLTARAGEMRRLRPAR